MVVFRFAFFLHIIHLIYAAPQPSAWSLYPPKIQFFQNRIDHFNAFQATTFPQKILTYDKFWKAGGPILMYLGNEGAIEAFYNNTGFMFTLAEHFNGLVVFAEHRYYGVSLPFGNESFTKENLGFLTLEQALADYASYITHLRRELGCLDCPAVTFGGSYGAMLVAWFRMKYPWLTAGGIASSASVYFYPYEGKQQKFWQQTLNVFKKYGSQECHDNLLDVIHLVNMSSPSSLQEPFSTCDINFTAQQMVFYIRGAMATLALLDYPYETDFVTSLPANPVSFACKLVKPQSSEEFLRAANEFLNVLVDVNLLDSKCRDISNEIVGSYPQKRKTLKFGGSAMGSVWNYQSCADFLLQTLSTDGFGFFPAEDYQLEALRAECMSRYGIDAFGQFSWIPAFTGAGDYSKATNLLFTGGEKDPWSWTDYDMVVSPTVKRIMAEGAAHHQDLRFESDLDSPDLKKMRQVVLDSIQEWLQLE